MLVFSTFDVFSMSRSEAKALQKPVQPFYLSPRELYVSLAPLSPLILYVSIFFCSVLFTIFSLEDKEERKVVSEKVILIS